MGAVQDGQRSDPAAIRRCRLCRDMKTSSGIRAEYSSGSGGPIGSDLWPRLEDIRLAGEPFNIQTSLIAFDASLQRSCEMLAEGLKVLNKHYRLCFSVRNVSSSVSLSGSPEVVEQSRLH